MLPQDYWELQPKPAGSGESRKFTPLALKQIDTAPDLALHSPMLAKSVRGKADVEAALKMAHAIQSASSYTSIIATPNLMVELFDCDADGYPMEGMWVSRLNQDGQIDDLTVYMRPYPAVTVLRTMAKALAEKTPAFSFLNEDIGNWQHRLRRYEGALIPNGLVSIRRVRQPVARSPSPDPRRGSYAHRLDGSPLGPRRRFTQHRTRRPSWRRA
jgi:hypothetical protein